MNVEALAVAELNRRIGMCPRLQPIILTNDRTLLTDGHIELFDSPRHTKSNWVGRVSVQVKGRTRRATQPRLTHPVPCDDLRSYQVDSGVLYFVVDIDPETGTCEPYYALLSPFVIDGILWQLPAEQRSVAVTLRPLPAETDRLEALLSLALETKNQNPKLGFDPSLFNDSESITVYTATPLSLDQPLRLSPEALDYALILHTAGGMSVPLNGEFEVYPPDYMPRQVDLRVSSGTIIFERSTISRVSANTHNVQLSEGLALTLTLSDEGRVRAATITVTPERNLSARLRSFEFVTALQDSGRLELNGDPLTFNPTSEEGFLDLRQRLPALRDMTALFDHLGVDTRLIDLEQLDDQQLLQLNALYRGFVLGEELHDPKSQSGRVLQQVGQWHVLFMVIPGSRQDMWKVEDPFSTAERRQFAHTPTDGGKPYVVTAYELIAPKDLPTVLNARLESIVDAYEAIAASEMTQGLANHRVLYLLMAVDHCPARRDEFLDAAEHLNEWLIRAQGPDPIHLVNRWQIHARRGPLSPETLTEIRSLKREAATNAQVKAAQLEVACSILLGDDDETRFLIGRLPEEQLKEIETWPIWTLR